MLEIRNKHLKKQINLKDFTKKEIMQIIYVYSCANYEVSLLDGLEIFINDEVFKK